MGASESKQGPRHQLLTGDLTRDVIIASIPEDFDAADVDVKSFGGGVYWIVVDYHMRDGVGRRIGGRADITVQFLSNHVDVRIHALRDNIAFGALRRRTVYAAPRALAAIWAKLRRQRASFAKRHKEAVQRDWAPNEHPARYGAS